jgi:hypothetical protein
MYYLIGKTLGHSYSAEIHRAFGKYPYELKALPPEALGEFLSGGDFDGMNVTIPYKSDVIPYLDEIDDAARKIGSVNTVVQRDGRLVGHNTDYAGFLSMGAAYSLQILGQKHVEPTAASLIMSLESVFAVLAGWLLLNEIMTSAETSGCVLMFIAVILSQIPIKKK